MVSFQCEDCGDVVTRKKLDNHQRRCYNAAITCIDCHATFYGNDHKSHTSCISEAQKYEGALYKDKKAKTQAQRTPKTPLNSNSTYQRPSVEDENLSSPSTWQVSKVDVPPPAPSPPRTVAEPPPNVFDYLVEERSPTNQTGAGAGSSSVVRPNSQRIGESSASSPNSSRPTTSRGAPLQNDGIVYGGGPIAKGFQKFDSDLTMMNVDSQNNATTISAVEQNHRTPAASRRLADVKRSESLLKREGSDKKRKRAEELDLSRHSSADLNDAAPAGLHSGLTGGLAELLGRSQSSTTKKVEASPLSPKKRSKHEGGTNGDSHVEAHYEERRPRHKRHEDERQSSQQAEDSDRHRRHKKHRHGDEAPADPKKNVKAIEYPSQYSKESLAMTRTSTTSHSSSSYTSHSELFLSLVDKPHSSQKGQSIWGTLKTFHESIQARLGGGSSDAGSYYDGGGSSINGSSQKEDEEKRLMKALRVKVNKYGEVVLFARPDFEVEGEDDVVTTAGGGGGRKRQRQIEG